jgi:acetylornithine deacetylase/succinyl-diaminopimelate desuccinylase-like protein
MLRLCLLFLAMPAIALGQPPISPQTAQKLAQGSFREYLELLSLGGSVPTDSLVEVLGAPFVIVPLVNGDNNQHTFDENMRVGHYIEGLRAIAGMLRSPF